MNLKSLYIQLPNYYRREEGVMDLFRVQVTVFHAHKGKFVGHAFRQGSMAVVNPPELAGKFPREVAVQVFDHFDRNGWLAAIVPVPQEELVEV